MTPASSREFGTVSEITLRPRKEAAVRPIEKKESVEEQIERVSRENKEKDQATSGESLPPVTIQRKLSGKTVYRCPFCKFTTTGGRGLGYHKLQVHPGMRVETGPKTERKQNVKAKPKAKPKAKKGRSMKNFKASLAAAREFIKTRKKKAGKAPKARKGIRDMGTSTHRGQSWAEMSAAQKKRHYKYQKEYRKKKRLERAAALGAPPTNGHAKGTFPPYPFRFCPDCAKPLPTVEHNGKVLPAAKPFCGDCGYKIPVMKG